MSIVVTSTPHSALHFWLCTIGLLLVWSVVLATAAPPSDGHVAPNVAVKEDEELKNTRHCKALCEHCGCLGFYCGEECICECNNENSDTECIATMQSNARKLAIPFEILIQGPSANRFVRNALEYEQNADRKLSGKLNGRNKRSTVVIYKPAMANALISPSQQQCQQKLDVVGKDATRHKRSTSQLDWFTDFANSLTRPAPLRTGSRKQDDVAVAGTERTHKRAIDSAMNRSWFADNNSKLLRPAPLFKRARSAEDNEVDDVPPAAAAMRAMEQLPQVLKDTLRNMKEAALASDFSDTLGFQLHDGGDVMQNRLQEDFTFGARNLRDDFVNAFSKLRLSDDDNHDVPRKQSFTNAPSQQSKYLIPWFRPVRFLKRVQQALN